jgi:hypothetical protein
MLSYKKLAFIFLIILPIILVSMEEPDRLVRAKSSPANLNNITASLPEHKLENEFIAQAIDMTKCITNFARNSKHKQKHMKVLGKWLTEKRKVLYDQYKWNSLIAYLTTWGIIYCPCECLNNQMTRAVRDVIIMITTTLQPGADCTDLLVLQAQEAIIKTTRAWNEAQENKISRIVF